MRLNSLPTQYSQPYNEDHHHYSHFRNIETEAWRGKGTQLGWDRARMEGVGDSTAVLSCPSGQRGRWGNQGEKGETEVWEEGVESQEVG